MRGPSSATAAAHRCCTGEKQNSGAESIATALRVGAAPGFAYRFVMGAVLPGGRAALAPLRAEAEEHGDLALLRGVVDGDKTRLSAKTLAWFVAAARLFPAAQLVAKCDLDTFVVARRRCTRRRRRHTHRRAGGPLLTVRADGTPRRVHRCLGCC